MATEREGIPAHQVAERAITQGRALVQITEASTMLLDNAGSPQERWPLRF